MSLISCTPAKISTAPATSTENSAQRRRARSSAALRKASEPTTAAEPRWVKAFARSVSQPTLSRSAISIAVVSPGVGPGSPLTITV